MSWGSFRCTSYGELSVVQLRISPHACSACPFAGKRVADGSQRNMPCENAWSFTSHDPTAASRLNNKRWEGGVLDDAYRWVHS